jgi:hypothetical protein
MREASRVVRVARKLVEVDRRVIPAEPERPRPDPRSAARGIALAAAIGVAAWAGILALVFQLLGRLR